MSDIFENSTLKVVYEALNEFEAKLQQLLEEHHKKLEDFDRRIQQLELIVDHWDDVFNTIYDRLDDIQGIVEKIDKKLEEVVG